MKPKMTAEQTEIADQLKLIERGDKVFGRKNFILAGNLGSGKSFLLKELSKEDGFEYINFSRDYLEDFYQSDYISFRYLDSNDFLRYASDKFSLVDSFYLLDALEPIIISIYQNGGKKKLVNLFRNLFIQKPRGNLLLSIPELAEINLGDILQESGFSEKNIFYLEEDSVKESLAEEYQLANVKVNEFKNNHYFKAYQRGE